MILKGPLKVMLGKFSVGYASPRKLHNFHVDSTFDACDEITPQ